MQPSKFSNGATSRALTQSKILMSETPFTQNQQIMSSILRANEYKQIEKLSGIKSQNEKLLEQLQQISKGRDLAVGHH